MSKASKISFIEQDIHGEEQFNGHRYHLVVLLITTFLASAKVLAFCLEITFIVHHHHSGINLLVSILLWLTSLATTTRRCMIR